MLLFARNINAATGRAVNRCSGLRRGIIWTLIKKYLRTNRTNRTNENCFVRTGSRYIITTCGNPGRTGRIPPINAYMYVYAHVYKSIGKISSGSSEAGLKPTVRTTSSPDEFVRLRPAFVRISRSCP